MCDLSDAEIVELASKWPTLERKPGKSDNWVEKTGGLPKYIDDIARALHYERGMTISRAIATAVGRVKAWASGRGGVKADTRVKATKAVAEWEAKKAASKARTAVKSLDSNVLKSRLIDLGMPPKKAESVGRELVSNLSESPGYWLVYYENRSTPDVIEDGEKPKQHKGYGKITSRRRPNEQQLKGIKEGRWIRVREDGKEPGDPGAKRSSYRPKLAARQKTKK